MSEKRTPKERNERTFDALDDLGEIVYRNYVNGNKSDARLFFRACPPDRRGYLAYSIILRHMNEQDNNLRVNDLGNFFKSVTE